MRLASITLPLPSGTKSTWDTPESRKYVAMETAHKEIETVLLTWCSGYTRIDVLGAWAGMSKTVTERGYRYEFTSPDNELARDELVGLAYRIKTISDEEAIFIVHANGETEFI